MRWEQAILKVCREVLYKGGEVRIVFIKRQNKRIPVITKFIDNKIFCDEEILAEDD